MARLKAPREESPVIPVPDVADIAAVLAACAGKDFRARRDLAMLRLMLETGTPRASAIARLERGQVDMRRDQVTVLDKGRKERVIPFGARAAHALALYLRARAAHPRAASPRLFLGKRGEMTRDGVYQVIALPVRGGRGAGDLPAQVAALHRARLVRGRRLRRRRDGAVRLGPSRDAAQVREGRGGQPGPRPTPAAPPWRTGCEAAVRPVRPYPGRAPALHRGQLVRAVRPLPAVPPGHTGRPDAPVRLVVRALPGTGGIPDAAPADSPRRRRPPMMKLPEILLAAAALAVLALTVAAWHAAAGIWIFP